MHLDDLSLLIHSPVHHLVVYLTIYCSMLYFEKLIIKLSENNNNVSLANVFVFSFGWRNGLGIEDGLVLCYILNMGIPCNMT